MLVEEVGAEGRGKEMGRGRGRSQHPTGMPNSLITCTDGCEEVTNNEPFQILSFDKFSYIKFGHLLSESII